MFSLVKGVRRVRTLHTSALRIADCLVVRFSHRLCLPNYHFVGNAVHCAIHTVWRLCMDSANIS